MLVLHSTGGVSADDITDLDFTEVDIPDSSKPLEDNNDVDVDDDSIDDDIIDGTDILDGTSFLYPSLWATEFDINSITLPETVMDEISSESFDLTDLYGLLGSQTDSLALNFEAFVEDTGIEIEAVKPMDLSTFNPVLDHYQDSWVEDLVYSSELG